MIDKLSIYLTIWLLLLLSAAAAGTAQPVPEAQLPHGTAQVYVYWPGQRWREKAGSRPEVQLDGNPVGLLRYKRYMMLEVPAGRHEFRLTGESEAARWDNPDQAFHLDLDPGETTYIRLLVKYDQQKNTWQNPGMSHVVQFLPRAEAQARKELKGLKAVKP